MDVVAQRMARSVPSLLVAPMCFYSEGMDEVSERIPEDFSKVLNDQALAVGSLYGAM